MYTILLVWPSDTTEITIGAPVSSSSTTVTLLGSSGIIIDVSNIKIYSLASDWAWVFKLQNVTPK